MWRIYLNPRERAALQRIRETRKDPMTIAFDQQTQAKQRFVRALAEYLSADLGRKSIELQMRKPEATDWATLRGATPLTGYQTVDETERELGAFLGVPTPVREP